MELNNSITRLKGMGPKTTDIFEKNGIHTVEDLLYFFPRAWINATEVCLIKDLRVGMSALLQVKVVMTKEGISQRTRVPYLKATVADISGSVDVMWFHARYLKEKIKADKEFLIYGKLQGWRAENAMIMSPKFITEPSIIPVYPTIGGLASNKTRTLMQQLQSTATTLPDYIPESIRTDRGIISLAQAVQYMHFPQTIAQINEARLRLGFDELLMLMVPSLIAKQERAEEQTEALSTDKSLVKKWYKTLPFDLTTDQKTTIDEILTDLAESKPMNRLVQGDVGSGKTVVGLAATLQAIASNKQVVWLAPTELLAQQHFATAQKLLGPAMGRLGIGLWTRTNHMIALNNDERKASSDEIMQQPIIIGTHALLSEKVNFQNLGLLIIDEQHRFGVKQRAQLRLFSGRPIHLLSMTATPIPRTMALVLYGDLKLSTIKHKPSGRKPVVTRVVEEHNRSKAYEFIGDHIRSGDQVYVVCPTIVPAKDDEANVFNQLFEEIEEKKAVTTQFEKLKTIFPACRVEMLHGKLKAKDKDEIMAGFRNHDIDILVSTTVIEVGVDVPNATFIVIEDADRFGLAQLHQLRGRVGRGEKQSFCLLFSSDNSSSVTANARLKTMEESNDGFVLAEKDLQLRGPGELTGLAQSGIPPLRFASLTDGNRIAEIREIARELIRNPAFSTSLDRFWRSHHPE
jgi:ATP-dependent DNA helicase RecG